MKMNCMEAGAGVDDKENEEKMHLGFFGNNRFVDTYCTFVRYSPLSSFKYIRQERIS